MQTWNIKVRINKTYLEVYCKLSVLFSVVLPLISKLLHDDIKSPRIIGGNCAQVWWYLEQRECRSMSYYSIVYKTLIVMYIIDWQCSFLFMPFFFKIAIWNDTVEWNYDALVLFCVYKNKVHSGWFIMVMLHSYVYKDTKKWNKSPIGTERRHVSTSIRF